jgi:mannitol-1-phosphate 5-dehydrogenase
MRALVFGPGRVGCGFVGDVLRASGHDVLFVASDARVAAHLNRVGRYRLRLVDRTGATETVVDGVRALCIDDRERVIEELVAADLIATCVRPPNLPRVAPLIAAALERRSRPVNVLAFENLIDAGRVLRELVAVHLPPGFPLARHGFSGVIVARAASKRLGDPAKNALLTFVADGLTQFVVDRRGLREPLPPIAGMVVTDQFEALARRKLCTFSAGHAATAYLGHLKGYRYIHAAIRDPEVKRSVLAAMREGRDGLACRYGRDFAGTEKELLESVVRFENAALGDTCLRVGRDPERKLAPMDRLVGAATLAEEGGIRVQGLALAIAAALCFRSAADSSSMRLQAKLRSDGPEQVLKRVCRIDPGRRLGRAVIEHWKLLSAGREGGSPLLRLDRPLWAWTSQPERLRGEISGAA